MGVTRRRIVVLTIAGDRGASATRAQYGEICSKSFSAESQLTLDRERERERERAVDDAVVDQ